MALVNYSFDDDPRVHFVNPNEVIESDDRLDMIHRGHVEEIANANGTVPDGQLRWRAQYTDVLLLGDPHYYYGGTVQNVRVTLDEGDVRILTLIVCDRDACDDCTTYTGLPPPRVTGDLPFVHSRHVVASLDGEGHSWRTTPATAPPEIFIPLNVTAFERRLVTFESGYNETSNPGLIAMEVAVCIWASCPSCLASGPPPSSLRNNRTRMVSPVRAPARPSNEISMNSDPDELCPPPNPAIFQWLVAGINSARFNG